MAGGAVTELSDGEGGAAVSSKDRSPELSGIADKSAVVAENNTDILISATPQFTATETESAQSTLTDTEVTTTELKIALTSANTAPFTVTELETAPTAAPEHETAPFTTKINN